MIDVTKQNSHSGHDLKYLNLAFLQHLSAGDDSIIREALELFKEESFGFVSKMNQNFLRMDFCALAKTAHSMKPTGSYIGVEELTLKTGLLEKAASKGDISGINTLVPEIELLISEITGEINLYIGDQLDTNIV